MTAEEFTQDYLDASDDFMFSMEEQLSQCVGFNYSNIIDLMQEYARLKCKELLEIVAEKAKIKTENNLVYQQPYKFYCNKEEHSIFVDKDSILNAVDLNSFIK